MKDGLEPVLASNYHREARHEKSRRPIKVEANKRAETSSHSIHSLVVLNPGSYALSLSICLGFSALLPPPLRLKLPVLIAVPTWLPASSSTAVPQLMGQYQTG